MAESDMEKTANEFLRFGHVEIEKREFCSSKKEIDVRDVDIDKILVSNEFAYRRNKETEVKYFTGYKTGKKIRPSVIHHGSTNE